MKIHELHNLLATQNGYRFVCYTGEISLPHDSDPFLMVKRQTPTYADTDQVFDTHTFWCYTRHDIPERPAVHISYSKNTEDIVVTAGYSDLSFALADSRVFAAMPLTQSTLLGVQRILDDCYDWVRARANVSV